MATTTAWDWLSQVNSDNFAGHSDWRLPSEAGINPPFTGTKELESILLAPDPCNISPCIDAIFGPTPVDTPTANTVYWSATTNVARPDDAWFVYFVRGNWGNDGKRNPNYVRAVRSVR